jgi:hypothetical protein
VTSGAFVGPLSRALPIAVPLGWVTGAHRRWIGAIGLGVAFGTVFSSAFSPTPASLPGGASRDACTSVAAAGNGQEHPPEWYRIGRTLCGPRSRCDGRDRRHAGLALMPKVSAPAYAALTRMLRAQMETPDGPLKLPGGGPERFINCFVAIMPPTAASHKPPAAP